MADNVVYCSQCGAQMQAGGGFCQKCGARLVSAASTPEPPAASGYPAAAPAYPAAATVVVPGNPVVPVLPESYYGGFWIRVAAYLLDALVISVITVPICIVLFLPAITKVIQQAQTNQEPGPEFFAAIFGSMGTFFIVVLAGQWLYEALLTSSSWQGTVGKRILRLKVTDDQGNRISFARATARFFAKLLSGWVMYIGFIMVAFMERKRGLHDIICSTQVLRY